MNTKLSLTLSILLGSAALFQGCSSTDDTEQSNANTNNPTVIEGSTTLASGPRTESKATVCLDLNNNNQCDDNEPQTHTNAVGDYKLTVDTEVSDGDIIVVEDGISMLPHDANSTGYNTLQMLKYYNSSEGKQNINVMSTVIVQELEANPSSTYEEVLATISNRYDYSEEMLLKDPIDVSTNILGDGSQYFRTVAALEIYMNRQAASAPQRAASLQRAAEADTTTAPTDDELDSIIDEYSTLFDDFLTSISEYIDELGTSLSDWYDSFFDDEIADPEPLPDGNTTNPDPDPEPEPEPDPEPVEITRPALEGTWYIVDASNDITCSTIQGDSMVVVEANGAVTNLSLVYDDTAKSIKLSIGWVSVETIFFDTYYDDATFNGHYGSDGETMHGKNMTNQECRILLGV